MESNKDEMQADLVRPAKRKRLQLSCTECTKKKAKCDRALPCGTCQTRRIPGLCSYLIAGYEDPVSSSQEVQSRLDRNYEVGLDARDRTEAIQQQLQRIENILRNKDQPGSQRYSTGADDHVLPPEEKSAQHVAVGKITNGQYYGPSALHSLEAMSAGFMGDRASNQNATTYEDTGLWDDELDAAMLLVNCVPAQPQREVLIDHYFEEINLTRFPIQELVFRDEYRQFVPPAGRLTSRTVHFLPLLFITLAISALSTQSDFKQHPSESTIQSHKDFARSMYTKARQALSLSDALTDGDTSLFIIMGEVLIARYLILIRRASNGLVVIGSAVRRAQALGLHRSSALFQAASLREEQAEERKRIWAHVYYMDRYLSLLLGRPLAIQDDDCDADEPEYLVIKPHVSYGYRESPAELRNAFWFINNRLRLARIMGDIVKRVYSMKPCEYREVLDLDAALLDWRRKGSLIVHGELLSPEVLAGDHKRDYVRRFVLSTDFNFTRIALHRPYFIERVMGAESMFQHSFEACYQAAIDDLWARSLFPSHGPIELTTGSYRMTTCAVILGVVMILQDQPYQRCLEIRTTVDRLVEAKRDQVPLDEASLSGYAHLELLRRQVTKDIDDCMGLDVSSLPEEVSEARTKVFDDLWNAFMVHFGEERLSIDGLNEMLSRPTL